MKNKLRLIVPLCFVIMAVNDFPRETPITDPEVEYSAASYFKAKNPGGAGYKNTLNINYAPNMIRFSNPASKHEPVVIFRYDKRVIWLVHPEMRGYEGVKLYQEFKLTSGMGINSHIDQIMRTEAALKSPGKLANLGEENIDGHTCTHYQMRKPNIENPDESFVTDYWISDQKILVKMQYSGAEVSGVLETKDIKFGKQSEDLFNPPPDYKKGGARISWKEEKQKLDAMKK